MGGVFAGRRTSGLEARESGCWAALPRPKALSMYSRKGPLRTREACYRWARSRTALAVHCGDMKHGKALKGSA